ncbi:MAG TPA: 2,3-dihydro-2,3-dihydroxybenzoate dehydrogenase [Cellvibrio sp.]|nr:2,3-dihydro-2,3-dihydroxybenzoate dehydrogenase [Cellvibrio sp.]
MYAEFKHKIVLVTGAAQGIGKAVADALLQAGARVVAADIQFTYSSLVAAGNFYPVHLDVSNSQAVNQLIAQIEKQIGAIDYLANVAGILRLNSLLETTDKEWQDTFAINTTGSFFVCRAVARSMVRHKRGAIVAVSSNAAQMPRMNMGSYAASKAALSQMIKCLGLELAQHNIRCNLVSPGSTDTDMQRQFWRDASGSTQVIKGSLENYRGGIPLQRIATPEAIAHSVLFLLSDHAAHITLENIIVDGGATLGC